MYNGVSFFEISTDNPIAAERFYGELFGWTFTDGHGDPYSVIRTPKTDGLLGGLWDNRADKAENWAIVCIEVADVEEACAKAVAAGGKVYSPPMETVGVENGPIFAHLLDPSGNHIAVYSRRDQPES
ncbi:VOC family protein [Sphaerisporangium dianthi]|uniref:VOC family protein n=1 Tax=Sphaerisporangium dianthi TaxID=1436120 RepID=A0ABV9CRM2_9ACTN